MVDMVKMRERALKAMKIAGVPTPINARHKFLEGTERTIKSPSVAEGLIRKDVLASREKPYEVRKLSLEKADTSENNALGFTTRGHNKSLWFAQPKATLVRYASGLEEVRERFSELFLVVALPEKPEEALKVVNTAIVVFNGYCYFFSDRAVAPVYPIARWDGQELGVEDWKNIPELYPLEADGSLKPGALLYNAQEKSEEFGWDSSSAGEIKQGAVPFICQNLPGFDVRAYKYAITCGASEILCEERPLLAMKDMAQAVNRLSQADAPQTAYGELDTVCWYLGKFQQEGFDHCDGLGFLTSEHFAHLASVRSAGKYRFTPESVRGICAQMRPASMCKLLAVSTMSSSVSTLMRNYGGADCVVLVRDQITQGDIDRVTRIIRDKVKDDPWVNKNLVICNDEKTAAAIKEGDFKSVQFYTDLNGLKCSYDLRMHVDHSILDVSHACHEISKGANTSMQMLGSLFAVDAPKTAKHLMAALKDFVGRKVERFFAAEGRKPSIHDFEGGDLGQVLVSILPQAARDFSFPLLKRLANKMAEGLTNRIGQLSVPVAGCYCKIIPDPAVHFGVHILKVHNGDSMDVIQPAAFKAGYSKGIAVKYPKCHIREFGKAEVHDTAWYIERVKACAELTDEQKAVCIDIAHVSGGAIMIPAYDAVMHMLAGLDYDGDALILYLEGWINDILKDTKPLSVYIDD